MPPKANKDMPTVSKTYMFYQSDITECLNMDLQPKHVFRMGLKAIKGNPEILDRINNAESEQKTNLERLHRMSKQLDLQCRKTEQLEKKLIEMGVKIDEMS